MGFHIACVRNDSNLSLIRAGVVVNAYNARPFIGHKVTNNSKQ